MFRFLQILICVILCVANVSGRFCIHASGQKKCTQGTNDCNSPDICMDIESGMSGNYRSLCAPPQSEGCLCDKNLVSSEACEPGLSCQQEDGKYKCLEADTVGPECDADNRQWKLVYHNDKYGSALDNTAIDDLVAAIQDGADVKVWTRQFNLLNVQKVSIAIDEDLGIPRVHGQSLFWTSPSTRGAFNFFFVFSTNGNVHLTQFFVGESENSGRQTRQNEHLPAEMKWFVRRNSAKVESVEQLFTTVKDGANVQVASDNSFRHLEVADIDNDRVQGLSIWEMRDWLRGLEFNTTEQWLPKHWSDNGSVHNASWIVNEHTMTESGVLHNVDIDWYVDTCWLLVYRHNDQGHRLSGSKDGLLQAIEEGKRVKLRIGTTFYEANSLRMDENNDVILHVYDSMHCDVTQGKWRWLNVSTNGMITTLEVGMGNDSDVTQSSNRAMVSWFVEKREWTIISPENDATAALAEVMDNGADVRFSVQIGDTRVWYQADGVSNMLGAHSEREVLYDGNQFVRRYSYAKWSVPSVYTYMDYVVGTTQQVALTKTTSVPITWYIGQ